MDGSADRDALRFVFEACAQDDDGRVKTSELSSKLQQAGGPAKLGVLLSVLQSSANAALDWEEALSLAQLDSAVPKLGRLPSSEEKRESMEADRGWAPGPGLCGPGVSLGEASLLLLFEGAEWETRVDVGLTVEYVKLLAREHFADSLRGVYADAQLVRRESRSQPPAAASVAQPSSLPSPHPAGAAARRQTADGPDVADRLRDRRRNELEDRLLGSRGLTVQRAVRGVSRALVGPRQGSVSGPAQQGNTRG